MKIIWTAPIAGAFMALAIAAPSLATEKCPKMEFAELQSKSAAELEFRYCNVLMDAGFEDDRFHSKLDFSQKYSAIGDRVDAAKAHKEAEEAGDRASQCRSEAVRAVGLYLKKSKAKKPSMPDCLKQIPGWKKEWELETAAQNATK